MRAELGPKVWMPKTTESICLPSNRKALGNLALAQAELGRSFGKEEAAAFKKQAGPALKSVFPLPKVLALADEAAGVAPGASPQAKKDFAAAGQAAEKAAKLQMARDELAEQKALKAARMASLNKK